jgi:putative chitinase
MSAEAVFDALRTYKREITGEGLSGVDVAAFQAIFATWKPADKNPTALSDGEAFFASVRKSFGSLLQSQVDGFETLLQAFGVARWPIGWVAYGLSTAWHETAATMQPVREAYWLSEDWRRTHLTKYYPAYGRGYCQITWPKNYARADDALDLNGALVANYDLALKPDIAARILVWGMESGAFTGRGLKDFLPLSNKAGHDAFKAARQIINGRDKDEAIAKEADAFQAALEAGGWR